MLRLIIALLLMMPAALQGQLSDDASLKDHFVAAEQRIAEYDFDGALKYLSTCYIKAPKEISYLLKIGYCHTQLGRYPDAKLFYGEALKVDSTHTAALSAIGNIFERERNYKKAQTYYRQLTQIDSTNSYYHKKFGIMSLQLGDGMGALLAFNQAHVYNPNDIEVITRLSTLYLAMNELDYTSQMVEKGLHLDPHNIPLLQVKARLHHKRKEHEKVVSTIQEIMVQEDTSEYYQMMIGVSYLHLDSLEQSLSHLSAIVDRKEDTEHTHHYLGLVHRKLGDKEKSRRHFEWAIDKGISPKVGTYYGELANLAESEGELRTAIDHYRSALSYGTSDETHFFLARASDQYFKDKRIAQRHYQDYLKTPHKDFQAYTEQRIQQLKEIIHSQR